MQFIFHENAGLQTIELFDEHYNYLIKARRSKIGDEIFCRNLVDDLLHTYHIEEITKKNCKLSLFNSISKPHTPNTKLEIIWCIIDPKTIEKQLPSLNQIGVSKIYFIKCDFSQGNFEPNLQRLNKILINSCEQCGRSDLMEFEIISKSKLNSMNFAYFDFGGKEIDKSIKDFDKFLFGPEGGFSQKELEQLNQKSCYKFNTNNILRSENAIFALSSIYLLS